MNYNNFIALVLLVVIFMGIAIHVQNKHTVNIYVYKDTNEKYILVNKHTATGRLKSEFLRKSVII